MPPKKQRRKVLLVKVGSDERPAGPADIQAVQEQLVLTANEPNLTIVTHHAIQFEWIEMPGVSETARIVPYNGQYLSDTRASSSSSSISSGTMATMATMPTGALAPAVAGEGFTLSATIEEGKKIDLFGDYADLKQWDIKESKLIQVRPTGYIALFGGFSGMAVDLVSLEYRIIVPEIRYPNDNLFNTLAVIGRHRKSKQYRPYVLFDYWLCGVKSTDLKHVMLGVDIPQQVYDKLSDVTTPKPVVRQMLNESQHDKHDKDPISQLEP